MSELTKKLAAVSVSKVLIQRPTQPTQSSPLKGGRQRGVALRTLALAICAALVAACTAPPAQETLAPEAPKPQVVQTQTVQKYVHDSRWDTDAAACAAQHGAIQPVCLLGTRMCVINFSDAGKTCSDSSECQGRCLAVPKAEQQQSVTGKCSPSNNPCGCISIVTKGVASPVMCID